MNFEYRKPTQRGITPFTASEHFLDYSEGSAELKTQAEIKTIVESDVRIRLDYEKFENAIGYCDQIRKIRIKENYLSDLKTNPHPIDSIGRFLRLDEWPPGFRWGVEATLIIAVLMTAVLLLPWERVIAPDQRSYITLFEAERSDETPQAEIPTEEPASQVAQYEDEDSGAKKPTPTATPAVSATSPAAVTPPATTIAPSAPAPTPTPVAAIKVKPTPVPAQPVAAAAPTVADEPPVERSKVSGGFLFRGTIQVTNLDPTANKFVEQINELGGRKAGEVELGWVRGNTRYFHFTMPEAKYADFEKLIAEHGKPVLTKEPHPRKMPEGIVRIILVVSEKAGRP